MKNVIFSLLAISIFIIGCESKTSTKEGQIKQIAETEKKLLDENKAFSIESAQKLMDMYISYVDNFPQDSLAPEMLMRCAIAASGSNQIKYAITMYERLLKEYPQSPLCPEALFREAFTYDDSGDKDLAYPLYERFLLLYPNDPLAGDAKVLLDGLDKTPEEFLEFLQQNTGNEEHSEQ